MDHPLTLNRRIKACVLSCIRQAKGWGKALFVKGFYRGENFATDQEVDKSKANVEKVRMGPIFSEENPLISGQKE